MVKKKPEDIPGETKPVEQAIEKKSRKPRVLKTAKPETITEEPKVEVTKQVSASAPAHEVPVTSKPQAQAKGQSESQKQVSASALPQAKGLPEKEFIAEVNIGTIGHVAHGKTTLVHELTGKWTQAHSEEIKRGLTIRLGYADFTVRRCPKCSEPECYTTAKKCAKHFEDTVAVRRISFVDSPGHETLMATMLTGAATMDGAVLVIAANEPCPQPQTKEHLTALDISGIKNIVIVQNKIDLITPEQAKLHYKCIKDFVKGTVAENAPIIPVSAQYGANIDYLIWAIEKFIPTPKRNINADPIFLIARSFDVNKPGTEILKIKGGVLGGILKQGRMKVNDEIEILPGRKIEKGANVEWQPIFSKVTSAFISNVKVNELVPGGSSGLGTELDPFVAKSDSLVGHVAGLRGRMPKIWHKMRLEVHLLERVVGSKEELATQPLKTNEPIMINAWTSRSVGIITKTQGNFIEMALKLPVCIYSGERIVLSRQIGQKWRLVGYGILKE